MWRSAFVGLLVAVVVVALWNSASGETMDTARIDALSTRVANLENRQKPIAPASIVVSGAFVHFMDPYVDYRYCQITPYGPNVQNTWQLACMQIDPSS